MARVRLPAQKKRKMDDTEVVDVAAVTYERFVSPAAEQKFKKVLANKELWLEKGFAMTTDDTLGLPLFLQAQITARGWQKFCAQPRGPIPTIVHEFYANSPSTKPTHIKVRGVDVPLSAEAIHRCYGLKGTECGFADYLGNMDDSAWDTVLLTITVTGTKCTLSSQGYRSIKRVQLNPEAKVWHHFLKTRLMPTTHDTTISQDRMVLIFCIMTGITVNIGNIISDQIRNSVRKLQGKLFFPCLITSLCIQAKVPGIDNSVRIPNPGVLTASVITRMMKDTTEDTTPLSSPIQTNVKYSAASPMDYSVHFASLTAKLEQQEIQLQHLQTLLQLSINHQKEFHQQFLMQQKIYMQYRKKFAKSIKLTLKKNFPDNPPRFPKFPMSLIHPFDNTDQSLHTDTETGEGEPSMDPPVEEEDEMGLPVEAEPIQAVPATPEDDEEPVAEAEQLADADPEEDEEYNVEDTEEDESEDDYA